MCSCTELLFCARPCAECPCVSSRPCPWGSPSLRRGEEKAGFNRGCMGWVVEGGPITALSYRCPQAPLDWAHGKKWPKGICGEEVSKVRCQAGRTLELDVLGSNLKTITYWLRCLFELQLLQGKIEIAPTFSRLLWGWGAHSRCSTNSRSCFKEGKA